MEKKKEGYRGSAGEDFIPYITIFFILGRGYSYAGQMRSRTPES
jgi:hypothetical protein